MYNNPVTTPPPAKSPQSGSKKRLLILVLFALLTLANVAFFALRGNFGKNNASQSGTDQEQALSELEMKYASANAQLDSLKGISPGAAAQIEALQQELASKRADIEQNIRLKGDLQAARREIDELVQQKDNAVLEVARLKEKVKTLDQQVISLNEEKNQYAAEKDEAVQGLSTLRSQLDETQNAKASLIAEKAQLQQSYQELNKQVESNSYLTASDVKVSIVAVNKKGKEKKTQSRKIADQFKICFQYHENALVPRGEEQFYIKIIDPLGATVFREDQGSGVINDAQNNTQLRYTTVATCSYQQQDGQACGAWDIGEDTPGKGKYSVEIYNRGRRVGSTEFKLK